MKKPWTKTTKLSKTDKLILNGFIVNPNYAFRYGYKRNLSNYPRLKSQGGRPKQYSFGQDYKLAKLRRGR